MQQVNPLNIYELHEASMTFTALTAHAASSSYSLDHVWFMWSKDGIYGIYCTCSKLLHWLCMSYIKLVRHLRHLLHMQQVIELTMYKFHQASTAFMALTALTAHAASYSIDYVCVTWSKDGIYGTYCTCSKLLHWLCICYMKQVRHLRHLLHIQQVAKCVVNAKSAVNAESAENAECAVSAEGAVSAENAINAECAVRSRSKAMTFLPNV